MVVASWLFTLFYRGCGTRSLCLRWYREYFLGGSTNQPPGIGAVGQAFQIFPPLEDQQSNFLASTRGHLKIRLHQMSFNRQVPCWSNAQLSSSQAPQTEEIQLLVSCSGKKGGLRVWWQQTGLLGVVIVLPVLFSWFTPLQVTWTLPPSSVLATAKLKLKTLWIHSKSVSLLILRLTKVAKPCKNTSEIMTLMDRGPLHISPLKTTATLSSRTLWGLTRTMAMPNLEKKRSKPNRV